MRYEFLTYRALQGRVTGTWYVGSTGVFVDAPKGEFEGESETVIRVVPNETSGKVQTPRRRADKHTGGSK